MTKKEIFILLLFAPSLVLAKYGIDESMSESSGDLGDMLRGGLLVFAVYMLWKWFFR